MNSPNPIIPQGCCLELQQQARSGLKVKIFCALVVNVAVLLVLLMQGCKREQPQPVSDAVPVFSDTNPPPTVVNDTNLPTVTAVETNLQPTVAEAAPGAPAAMSEYIILKGDTFSTIARKFGVTIKAIQVANPGVDPAKLQIGKKIAIPTPSVAAPTAAASGAAVPAADNSGWYKVKSGDTLSKIATEHHTTVKAIQSANNLTDTRIKVGQQLKLPAKAVATEAAPVPAPAPAPAR